MKVHPLYDRVLLKRLEEQEVKRGGIIIPDTAKEKPRRPRSSRPARGGSTMRGRRSPSPSRRATTFSSASTAAPK